MAALCAREGLLEEAEQTLQLLLATRPISPAPRGLLQRVRGGTEGLARVEGPVVAELQGLFIDHWERIATRPRAFLTNSCHIPAVSLRNNNSVFAGSRYQPSRCISLSSCPGAQPEKPR